MQRIFYAKVEKGKYKDETMNYILNGGQKTEGMVIQNEAEHFKGEEACRAHSLQASP